MPLTGTYEPVSNEMAREQAETYERTGGREMGTMQGVPVVIVTSVGAKTGHLRKHPVMRVEHEGRYAVIASKGGDDEHPTWYRNLIEEPHVELQDGAERHDYEARLVEGDEKRKWWERATAVWPAYDEYQRSTDRPIPVFVLSRRDD